MVRVVVSHALTTMEAAHGTVRLSWELEMMGLKNQNEQTDHSQSFEEHHPLDVSAYEDLKAIFL